MLKMVNVENISTRTEDKDGKWQEYIPGQKVKVVSDGNTRTAGKDDAKCGRDIW